MDIEQLKLIISTLNNVGVEVKPILLIWMALEYLIPFVIGLLALIFIYKTINKIIRLNNNDYEEVFIKWRSQLRIGYPGPLSNREFKQIVDKIDDLIKKSIS